MILFHGFRKALGLGGRRRLAGRSRNSSQVRFLAEALEYRRMLSGGASVTTYHNDSASTGANLGETVLTPANVNVGTFGKYYSTPVDGQVYGQPLYVSGVNVTAGSQQGLHDVAYVVTEHDSLYAVDAA